MKSVQSMEDSRARSKVNQSINSLGEH